MPAHSAVIFDLDGTLLDTLDDLGDSMNAVLASLDCPTHPIEAYKLFVGDGVIALAQRALPGARRDDATITEAVTRMRDEYGKRWAGKTRPYDGVPEMLQALHGRGLKLAVLSNKPDDFTKLTVGKLLPADVFDIVAGVTPERPKKPDPAGAIEIARTFNVSPESIAYVGDTNTDMQTAVAAGMFAVGVTWGFRPAAELTANGAQALIDAPGELLELL